MNRGRHSKVLQAYQADSTTKNKQYAIKVRKKYNADETFNPFSNS
jgi:hypothetical protein